MKPNCLAYAAHFKPEDGGFVITFPDLPEAITEGDTEQEALEYGADALLTVLSEYINRRRDIPRPRKARGKHVRLIPVPALAEAKIGIYEAMRHAGLRKADLARRLGWQKSQVDRLLDLKHASRLDQIETALAALRKRLALHIEDVA